VLDKALEVMSWGDWLSPMLDLAGRVVHRGGYTFLIPYDACPMTGRDVLNLLKRRGVTAWAPQLVAGVLMVTVKQDQARWASHLLQQAGVPLENALPAAAAAGGRTRATRTRSDIVSRSRILRGLRGGRR